MWHVRRRRGEEWFSTILEELRVWAMSKMGVCVRAVEDANESRGWVGDTK